MLQPTASIPMGVVIRKAPGVTRWAAWSWQVVAVVPGAGPADWKEMRRDGETVDYHAATLTMDLWRAETEAYVEGLRARVPSVFVVLRQAGSAKKDGFPYKVHVVTASPYEAQDYQDSGEEVVERVPMPEGLAAFVQAFVDEHHREEPFVKRKRGRKFEAEPENGRGDPRIRQASDVYRAPGTNRPGSKKETVG